MVFVRFSAVVEVDVIAGVVVDVVLDAVVVVEVGEVLAVVDVVVDVVVVSALLLSTVVSALIEALVLAVLGSSTVAAEASEVPSVDDVGVVWESEESDPDRVSLVSSCIV